MRVRIEELQAAEKTYLTKIATLEQKCRENKERLRILSSKYNKDLADKDLKLEAKNHELNDLSIKYQKLKGIKAALDMKISSYRKLYESEKQPLNISVSLNNNNKATSASYPKTSKSQLPQVKKRRLQEDIQFTEASSQYKLTQQNTLGVEIDHHDQSGKQVCLVNTTIKKVNISNFLNFMDINWLITKYIVMIPEINF